MIDNPLALKVVNVRNCPFYEVEDWFVVSGQSVMMPAGHPTCLILARELTSILFTVAEEAVDGFASLREEVYNCGGCTGLVKFQIADLPGDPEEQSADPEKPSSRRKGAEDAPAKGRQSGPTLSGTLDEISPSELLQFFHMHQKTGKLMLHMPEGTGRVAFREGAIIGARFEEKENKDAVFALLAVETGRFSFVSGIPPTLMVVEEIGDFMMLLMEGIKMLDEGREGEQ